MTTDLLRRTLAFCRSTRISFASKSIAASTVFVVALEQCGTVRNVSWEIQMRATLARLLRSFTTVDATIIRRVSGTIVVPLEP